jgi:hypothetical protein
VSAAVQIELSAEQRREVAAWIEANSAAVPEPVRIFLAVHHPYLAAEGDPRRALDAAMRELRRVLRLSPSSEKRRSAGSALDKIPPAKGSDATSPREAIEQKIARGRRLAHWHDELNERHNERVVRLAEKLAKMPIDKTDEGDTQDADPIPRLEDIELTDEQRDKSKAASERFIEHLLQGDGPDPSLSSVNETLMPGGAVLVSHEHKSLPAQVPEALAEAREVKTLWEPRVRYDFSVAVKRIELDVEKKILEDATGDRHVVAGSTIEYGPPRYSVTWHALATLTVLVAQFAMPFNRLATLLSTPDKAFKAGALSRMLHYVAERLLPIYLELATQLANAEILAGDDTSCRVLEVSAHFAKPAEGSDPPPDRVDKPPWADYATPSAAEASLKRCEQQTRDRVERREAGDRTATRSKEEIPSLGVRIGRRLRFEWPRKNGDGPKEAMHTTVVSGRSVADDPHSLIVLYRSHLGSCGNLYESILHKRDPQLTTVILQGDMSPTNRVTHPELVERFDIRLIGCYSHARRPFALYEDDDPVRCGYMLHLFTGLAIHEQQLGDFGRNRDNVLAVRGNESNKIWNDILELAKTMAKHWSKATKLGNAARYIINHFDALTAYLDDPRLEPSNNLRERMLRMEKLIEGSSMFRKSLEGRFVLDVVRTILQTAVAAGVPVHEYLVSVLRANPDDVAASPHLFTPRAWATNHSAPEVAPTAERS